MDNTIRLWNIVIQEDDMVEVIQIWKREFNGNPIQHLTVADDSSMLFSGFKNGNVMIWDIKSLYFGMKEMTTLEFHTKTITFIELAHNSKIIAIASEDKTFSVKTNSN